jgi:N-acetylmuramoyl-L-alanine amidase
MRFFALILLVPLAVLATSAAAQQGKSRATPARKPVVRDSNVGFLPPIVKRVGPLDLRVVYPSPSDIVSAGDRSFLFGSTGSGDARLTINDDSVRVWPNGAFIAWLPLPADSVMQFELVAYRPNGERDSLSHSVRRARRAAPPDRPLWIDSTSLTPRGRIWWPADEYLRVSVRATEGAAVRLRLADGTVIPLAASVGFDEVAWGIRAFDRDTANLQRPTRADRYAGVLRGRAIGADPGPLLGAEVTGCPRCRRRATAVDTAAAVVEAIQGADTVRVRWPLNLALLDSLPAVVEFNDDTAGKGDTDRLTIGRAAPGATYNWFWPTGTRANASGRMNGDLRIRLSATSAAWVPAADAYLLPAGTRPSSRASVP